MAEADLKIRDGMVVRLDYTLRLDNGGLIGSSAERDPLEYLQGRGQIIPGLEQALYGLAVGDQKSVVVAPVDGYGDEDLDAFEIVSRDVFPPDLALKVGTRLNLRDQSGNILTAFVAELRPNDVLIDFNHPLAGETLYFDVKVVSLRPASSEELDQRHAHDASQEH